MDECYQYNGSSQYTRQGWNAGQLYSTTYSGATACVQLDNTTTPASTADPYDGRCWAGSGYPAATTGLQHAYGVLFLLAKNGVPVTAAVRPNKEATVEHDF